MNLLPLHFRGRLALATVFVPALAGLLAWTAGLRWQVTSSVPPGIYRLTRDPADPFVSFCLTGELSAESIARRYRPKSWTCQDGYAPLLKPVVARAGDKITISALGVAVNGRLLPNTVAAAFDGDHRPMHRWPAGSYAVHPDDLWVVSSFNKASYDSRYYGPVSRRDILGYAHPVWLFATAPK